MHRATRVTPLVAIALSAMLLAGGCADTGGIRLETSDQIAQPGQTIDVTVAVVREGLARWFPPRNPPTLRVYRDNDLLKEYQPGGSSWSFVTRVRLDTIGEHVIDAIYQRRRDSKPDQATCHAYCWDSSRVAIVVDLDRCVNLTTRMDRVMGDRPLGEVRPEAAEVLSNLAQRFYLCYVTTLGPDKKEDIRGWMRTNKVPPGPIFTWDRGRKYAVQPGDQARALARLRDRLPTLLIGIGTGDDDLAAFTANKMMPVMIQFAGAASLNAPPGTPEFATWREAYQLFIEERNQPILADPTHMLDLHLRGGHYLNPAAGGS